MRPRAPGSTRPERLTARPGHVVQTQARGRAGRSLAKLPVDRPPAEVSSASSLRLSYTVVLLGESAGPHRDRVRSHLLQVSIRVAV
ncbi:hypothetical protein GCM10010282_68950 [Streptomyces roseolus]|nr:hypothetical protein GCM10010282_68950 [Streptomyces roseolus]